MGMKSRVRHFLAMAVGILVTVGSMLAGESGPIVTAEAGLAERDAERAMDSIDGEG